MIITQYPVTTQSIIIMIVCQTAWYAGTRLETLLKKGVEKAAHPSKIRLDPLKFSRLTMLIAAFAVLWLFFRIFKGTGLPERVLNVRHRNAPATYSPLIGTFANTSFALFHVAGHSITLPGIMVLVPGVATPGALYEAQTQGVMAGLQSGSHVVTLIAAIMSGVIVGNALVSSARTSRSYLLKKFRKKPWA